MILEQNCKNTTVKRANILSKKPTRKIGSKVKKKPTF